MTTRHPPTRDGDGRAEPDGRAGHDGQARHDGRPDHDGLAQHDGHVPHDGHVQHDGLAKHDGHVQYDGRPDHDGHGEVDHDGLGELLTYLKLSRGFDFAAYKRAGLLRRVNMRTQLLGLSAYGEYLDYLQVDPDEFTRLFNTILINVTTFFRDPQSWEYLADSVLPGLVGGRNGTTPIRVWSAGCASGQESYSIAILLAELLGLDRFRDRVKIYATDADDEALGQARLASYTERDIQDVPPPLLEKYFDQVGDRFVFSKELRRSVIFGRHDLIQDAPISRVQLLICRNCLMYFNAETQARILGRFHFALGPAGVLFLGKAETLLTNNALFRPLDIKRRLFIKSESRPAIPTPLFDSARPSPLNVSERDRIQAQAAETAPTAQLLVSPDGVVVEMNQRLRTLFGLSLADVGRRLQDLEVSYRPFELRSCVDRAYSDGRTVTVVDGAWITPTGEKVLLDLTVIPVPDGETGFLGVGVYFEDVTRQRRLQEQVHRTGQDLETALEELQSTNEELETTNEELQSTVEELETTNEELQSTNEELETMNEELQSVNAELQAINEESRERSDEVGALNAFLESILASLRGAVVVVDGDLRVTKWNARAEDLWGLRPVEVLDRNVLNLDIGLPVERLRATLRACIAGERDHPEIVLDAVNRRGKPVRVRVTCASLASVGHTGVQGAILVMEDVDVLS